MAVINRALKDTGFAVVSVKTTGLTSGYDWICEIAIVRADPGQPLKLTLDTLVAPSYGLASPAIHGITDADLEEAPTIEELSGAIIRELVGRVVVGYNFDIAHRFLREELAAFDILLNVPYIDLMSLYALVIGKNVSLARACEALGIAPHSSPYSAANALDTAKLLRALVRKLEAARILRLSELRRDPLPPFFDSLELPLLGVEAAYELRETVKRVSRYEGAEDHDPSLLARSTYYEELLVVLDDLEVTDEEIKRLAGMKAELGLATDEVYALHARLFAGELTAFVDEGLYDDEHLGRLKRLRTGLQRLGWAPGD